MCTRLGTTMNLDYNIWISGKDGQVERNEITQLHDKLTALGNKVLVHSFQEIDAFISSNGGEFYYKNKLIQPPQLVLLKNPVLSFPDFNVLRQLEAMGTIAINSADSTDISRNKSRCGQVLMANQIPTPEMFTIQLNQNNTLDLIEKKLGFPCVIKVIIGSYGNGVILCKSRKEFEYIRDFMSGMWQGQFHTIIAQKFISSSNGMDVRVLVVGDRVLGGMKRIGTPGDFRSNIAQGGAGQLYSLTQETQELCLKVVKTLDLKIAGIDLLFDDNNGFTICEVNPCPGFAGFEKSNSINVSEVISSYCNGLIK